MKNNNDNDHVRLVTDHHNGEAANDATRGVPLANHMLGIDKDNAI